MSRLQFDKTGYEYYNVKNIKEDYYVGIITKRYWNRWTWEQYVDCIMSRGCLKEVVDFMTELGGKD